MIKTVSNTSKHRRNVSSPTKIDQKVRMPNANISSNIYSCSQSNSQNRTY